MTHHNQTKELTTWFLSVGEDLPLSSGDADDGCQWEVQTEGLCSLLGLTGVGRPRRPTLF
jgi:hypothetical protein